MKLVRYGEIGAEKPGLIDSNGNVRDLSTVVSEINGDALSESSLTKLNDIEIDSLNVVPGNPRLGLPISGTPKLICIGLNYSDHAKESNMPIPTEPVVFMKAISALNGRLGSRASGCHWLHSKESERIRGFGSCGWLHNL